MSIIPYKIDSKFAERIDKVISESGICAEVKVSAREKVREIIISDIGAEVVILVGDGTQTGRSRVRIGFREGILHGLIHGNRSLDLAKRVETLLRATPESDIAAEAGWLAPDPSGPANRIVTP